MEYLFPPRPLWSCTGFNVLISFIQVETPRTLFACGRVSSGIGTWVCLEASCPALTLSRSVTSPVLLAGHHWGENASRAAVTCKPGPGALYFQEPGPPHEPFWVCDLHTIAQVQGSPSRPAWIRGDGRGRHWARGGKRNEIQHSQ